MAEPCWRYVSQDTGDGLCLRCGEHEFEHPDVRVKAKQVTDETMRGFWNYPEGLGPWDLLTCPCEECSGSCRP